MPIPARSADHVDPASSPASGNSYSTVIESDFAVVADRTVSWDSRGYGSHAETASRALAALVSRGRRDDLGVRTLLSVAESEREGRNAHSAISASRRPGADDQDYTRAPTAAPRSAVDGEDAAGLADTDVSAEITSTGPIIAERAMYLTDRGQPFGAGHGSAGVTAASTNWFLAEGATGTFFECSS